MKKGKVSTTGYRSDSKDRNNSFNIIPTNQISMKNVNFPVIGKDNLGNTQFMVPGQEYSYPGDYVVEVPYKKQGGNFNTMKKVSTKGIAYPQQPTAAQFFQMTFNPNAPRSFYRGGGGVRMQSGGPTYVDPTYVPPVINSQAETVNDETMQIPANFQGKNYHFAPATVLNEEDRYYKTMGDIFKNVFRPNKDPMTTYVFKEGGNFNQGAPHKGSAQWHLAQTFRNMAKKQFSGSSAPQNADSDSIIDNRRNTMQNFLSQNTMRALAFDEADQMAGAFMQMGGNFGFNPNMYGQSMYADQVSQGKNQMHQDFGDFFNSGMNVAMTANPYDQFNFKRQGGPIKRQTGGQQPYTWTDVQNDQQAAFDAFFDTYDPNIPVSNTPSDNGSRRPATTFGANASPNIRSASSGYGTGYSQRVVTPSGASNASINYQPNYADECETLFNTQAEVDECIRQKKGLGTSQTPVTGVTTGPRGNYIEPQNNFAQPGSQGNYVQQPDGTLAFISGQQPYGYFPMNNNPYYKIKGRGPMWGSTGAPNIAYNPNNTFLKDYEYKGRLFGQGPRKVTMTFQHGIPTAVDESGNVVPQGTGTNAGINTGVTPNQPNQNFDFYLQQNVDPALYSKVLNGTATQDEFMEFNDQKMQLENQFQNSRMRQIPAGLSPDVKPSFKNRFANFQQSNQERGNRKGFRRTPPRESGVHLGFANKQYGGSMEDAQGNMLQPSLNSGEESTVVWKRKMGLDPENAVAWGLSGMDMLSSFGESQEKRRNEEMLRARMNADALFQPLQFGDMSRGDYETNTGMFRPDQNVPVQFQGQNFGQIASGNTYKGGGEYQNGGEYYLTDVEIAQIKRMGGQIQFLD